MSGEPASVAAALAQNVCRPAAAGFGGGTGRAARIAGARITKLATARKESWRDKSAIPDGSTASKANAASAKLLSTSGRRHRAIAMKTALAMIAERIAGV